MKKQKAFSVYRERWMGEDQEHNSGSGGYWGARSGEMESERSFTGKWNDETARSGFLRDFVSCRGWWDDEKT